MEKDAASWDKT
jgi:hypothetical protein